jgi:hypothetical protein
MYGVQGDGAMKRIHKTSRQNLRRIIISLLIVILAALSPNIAAADEQNDRAYTKSLLERNVALQDRIKGMRKQMGKAARSKGMQFSGGASTNRLAGNTVGSGSRTADRSQSRLPSTGIRTQQTQNQAYSRTPETLRHKDRATSSDRDFEIVKNRLDALENKLRANRRLLKRYQASYDAQGDDDSRAQNLGLLNDRDLIEMERETQRIEKEVGAYSTAAGKGGR